MKTIICIFAHPDDEAFGPGGSIAKLSQENNVYIICATRGDAANGPKDLGNTRSQELQRSAKILGVQGVIFLDFKDGDLCNNKYHDIVDALRPHLERLRPHTLITFEPRGVSGHIDHIVMSMVTSYLFERLSFSKKLMYFCQTESQMLVIKRVLPDYFVFFPPGYPDAQISETIETVGVWDIRKKAIYEHQSQKEDIDFIMKIYNQLPKEEHFLVWEK